MLLEVVFDCVDCPLPDTSPIDLNSTHTCNCGERDEAGVQLRKLSAAQIVFLFGQDYDRTSFRGLVSK